MKNASDLADALLASMREELIEFMEQESQISSSAAYEERVLELSRKFARGIIAKSQGKLPKSRNLKKSVD